MGFSDVIVGRQGVHRTSGLAGYELLFRSNVTASGQAPTADQRTAAVMVAAVSIGLERLVSDHGIFCAADRAVLTGEVPMLLPPERTVLSVAGGARVDDEVVAGCRELVRRGFTLAVSHDSPAADAPELLELADIVRVDTALASSSAVTDAVSAYEEHKVTLLADRVANRTDLPLLADAGFELFQGFALDRPTVVAGKAVSPGSVRNLSALAGLMGSDVDFEELEALLRRDPALAYHVMQLASLGRPGETRVAVDSIRTALVRAGVRRVKNWLAVLLARPSGRETECYDQLVTVLLRARACEQITQSRSPGSAGMAFAAGMLSGLDILLETPLDEIAATLELTPELHDAAFGGGGELSDIVRGVTAYQLTGADTGHLPRDQVEDAFASAFPWAFDCADAAVR
ncbi:EAL and modified HD-GYP domain-containing signal transduction protein [Jatrophihabitans endophyticus]|uniref:EAL and modified HD-GYP domain-containing signal transduction protein n=1 Tax=Jatrophihabitans endophyticus TaxID=1206085 RepID=A0A1M5II96_9ACTN|nr:HDOD domain-containing protein [Jatrophihabitans endophyticus]SHG27966.1 EAL and modified HD-GYP domain-containing signal transduction protein [Jatrophihabitans endophyticus]